MQRREKEKKGGWGEKRAFGGKVCKRHLVLKGCYQVENPEGRRRGGLKRKGAFPSPQVCPSVGNDDPWEERKDSPNDQGTLTVYGGEPGVGGGNLSKKVLRTLGGKKKKVWR